MAKNEKTKKLMRGAVTVAWTASVSMGGGYLGAKLVEPESETYSQDSLQEFSAEGKRDILRQAVAALDSLEKQGNGFADGADVLDAIDKVESAQGKLADEILLNPSITPEEYKIIRNEILAAGERSGSLGYTIDFQDILPHSSSSEFLSNCRLEAAKESASEIKSAQRVAACMDKKADLEGNLASMGFLFGFFILSHFPRAAFREWDRTRAETGKETADDAAPPSPPSPPPPRKFQM